MLLRVHIDRETYRTLHVDGRVHTVWVGGIGDYWLGCVRSDVAGVWRIVWLGRGIRGVLGSIFYCG